MRRGVIPAEATERFPPVGFFVYDVFMALPQRKHPIHTPLVERSGEAVIVFLTVCTLQRKPILAATDVLQRLEESWRSASTWMVGRFVVMPDHLHLFCAPAERDGRSLRDWVRYWKVLVSRRWPRPAEQPVWQLNFWDTQLRRGHHYDEKWDYVRENPVRAGLVSRAEDWPFQGELNELRQ